MAYRHSPPLPGAVCLRGKASPASDDSAPLPDLAESACCDPYPALIAQNSPVSGLFLRKRTRIDGILAVFGVFLRLLVLFLLGIFSLTSLIGYKKEP